MTLPYLKPRRRIPVRALVFLLVLAGAGYALWHGLRPAAPRSSFVTSDVARGTLTQGVNANGTINPVTTVTVGTQVTGPVLALHADFNDTVKKGQLLAEIDPALLQAQINQTEAQINTSHSALKLSEKNLARLKRLYAQGYVALAEVERAEQEVISSRSSYTSQKAQLDRDQKNLEYANVRSPIDGVVISRTVSIGQTLQSSFQAPEMFKIAASLTQMQIDLKLSEVDIGNVKEGQKVTFAVDAYPDRRFDGVLTKVRLNPDNQQGSVTYTGVVAVENADKALLPGMTAYVNIIITEKENVLYVPNAALRFIPSTERKTAAPQQGMRSIYLLKDDTPQRVEVKPGIANERYTEIESDAVKEGDSVILRENVMQEDLL